jgi:hypothetical protein
MRTAKEPGISVFLSFSAVLCGLNLKMTHYLSLPEFWRKSYFVAGSPDK